MLDDLFYPNERKGLWTREMIMLSLSNFLLYAALYIFLPSFPYWLSGKFGCSLLMSSLIVGAFAIAMFLPGPFNNYILDTYKRKRVGFWAFVFLGVMSVSYLWALSFATILIIRSVQGMLFSVITTTTSSTLVIDVTPTKKRNIANLAFTRFGRAGMMGGVLAGIYMFVHYDISYMVYGSAIMSVVSAFMVLMVRVPFRAPLMPALCSLDRFLLPRALPAALNVISVPIILGLLIASLLTETQFVELTAGFIAGYILMYICMKNASIRREVEISSLFIVAGFIIFFFNREQMMVTSGIALLGIGLSIQTNVFYVMIMNVPLHCERGSANNTYNLFWELGMMLGLILGFALDTAHTQMLYIFPVALTLFSLLLYELVIHKWYIRQMNKNNINN